MLLDPLGVVTKTRESKGDLEDHLAEAPPTILEGEMLEKQNKQNLFYTPVAGDVPEISVPEFLPELSGTVS